MAAVYNYISSIHFVLHDLNHRLYGLYTLFMLSLFCVYNLLIVAILNHLTVNKIFINHNLFDIGGSAHVLMEIRQKLHSSPQQWCCLSSDRQRQQQRQVSADWSTVASSSQLDPPRLDIVRCRTPPDDI